MVRSVRLWRAVLQRSRSDWPVVLAAWLLLVCATSLLRSVVRREGITAFVVTHDPIMLDVADRILELRDGRLAEMGAGAAAVAGH